MNRDSIITLINERKALGVLTEQDYYDIGIAHRKLPKAERSWSWLLSLTGGFKSPEAYRHFVLHRLTTSMKTSITESEVDAVAPTTSEEKLLEIKHEIIKEKMKLSDERRGLNTELRIDARFDELGREIVEAVSKLPKLKVITSEAVISSDTNTEAILMLSDWHIGQDCDNFYNKYNKEIAEERVNIIIDKAITYCQTMKINTLHVLNLGDLFEGKIHSTGRINSNEKVIEQMIYASELMANALNKLQAYIPTVTYRSVVDNHSSIDSNYKDRLPQDNMNLIVNWHLKTRLAGSKIIFKDDNLDIGLGMFNLNNNMKVAFMHGHEDPKDKTLQNVVGATHEWIDIVCSGHLHNPAEHVFQDMRLFINGSLCGTGPYALSHRLFTKPSQKMIVLDSGNFIDIDLSVK